MNKTVSELNRRQFLGRLGLGVSASLLASSSLVQADDGTLAVDRVSALTKDELPTAMVADHSLVQKAVQSSECMMPSIETRLFASSNVGYDETRNEVALQRVACAGFKVQNPEIVSRQYLRFAGTDSQRASDLQNIATGAIAAPKLLLGVRGGYGASRI